MLLLQKFWALFSLYIVAKAWTDSFLVARLLSLPLQSTKLLLATVVQFTNRTFRSEQSLMKSICAFQIPHAMQDQHGRYRCEITSSTERMWTNEVDVVIGMPHFSAFFWPCNCSPVKPALLSLHLSDYLLCSWLKAPRISVQFSEAMECSEGRVERAGAWCLAGISCMKM